MNKLLTKINTKICSKCEEEKDLSCFYKDITKPDNLHTVCKICHTANVKKWAIKNPDKRKKIIKKYCDTNREKLNEKSREYFANNREAVLKSKKKCWSKNKEQFKKTAKIWRSNNKDKKKLLYLKYMENPSFKLNNAMRSSLYKSIKENKKGRHWESLTGFTLRQLKTHLKKKFLPGMSFDNYGEWQIDHILPIAKFNFEKPEDEDFKRCWALKNLQPLWAIENARKKDTLKSPNQQSFIFTQEV